jgi:rhamnosyltransferase
MFMNVEFQKYWKNLPKLSDYKKTVKILETKMTKYFENKGFISDSYIDVNLSLSNPMLKSYDLICNYKLPVIKRKEICGVFDVLINEQPSNQVNKVIAFLKNKTEYNTDMIYEDIINTQPMSEIQQCFRCNYILSNQYVEKEKANNCKIALILYIYYPDLVEYCYNYAKSMPEYSDIYIVVSREDTKKRCAEVFKNFPCNKLEIRVKPNRGRDVSAYLVTCKDVFAQYDYVCCMHDKKLQLLLISSSDMNFQNIVSNLV